MQGLHLRDATLTHPRPIARPEFPSPFRSASVTYALSPAVAAVQMHLMRLHPNMPFFGDAESENVGAMA